MALKERNPARCGSCWPICDGSGLYGWVKNNDLSDHRQSSITEGIGQSRVPENLVGAPIDDAERIPDAEALEQIFDRADP